MSQITPGWGAALRRPAMYAATVLSLLAGRAAFGAVELPSAGQGPGGRKDSANVQACARATLRAWPAGSNERREVLARLQAMLSGCIEEPDFLAVLGALLLEQGDAAQALVWLERALLLDPGNLGAQADHALALSELGQPDALRELARQWRTRTDLPPGLRSRLYLAEPIGLLALPAVKFGLPPQKGPSWGIQADATLLAGHESNLDRSPRLTELTLSAPTGPVVLPVISVPRRGTATQAIAALQAAYSPKPTTVLRSALNLSARRAGSERATDWHQTQWTAEWLQRGEGWRTQLDVAASWVGGPLNEPYRLTRLTLSGEVPAVVCAARLSYADERRTQSASSLLDSKAAVVIAGIVCPLPGTSTWSIAVSSNAGRDRPDSPERPGGRQKLATHVVRAVGTVGADTVIDISQRLGSVRDSEGYSVLLENNAVRSMTLSQTSLEVAQPLRRAGWPGLTALVQWQTARQTSNLPLFAYRADTFYAGLRWAW